MANYFRILHSFEYLKGKHLLDKYFATLQMSLLSLAEHIYQIIKKNLIDPFKLYIVEYFDIILECTKVEVDVDTWS